MSEIQSISIQSFLFRGLTFLQIPCSASEASVWMEKTIAQFVKEESTQDELIIPQRLNQQHQLGKYSIDACREDQFFVSGTQCTYVTKVRKFLNFVVYVQIVSGTKIRKILIFVMYVHCVPDTKI